NRVRMLDRVARRQLSPASGARGDLFVAADRSFHDDKWTALRLEREIRAIQSQGTLASGADGDVDPFLTQKIEPATADTRIGIHGCRHDSSDTRSADPFDARSRAPDVAARS